MLIGCRMGFSALLRAPLAGSMVVLSAVAAAAQQVPTLPPPNNPNPSAGANLTQAPGGLAGFFSSRTPYEFWLTCIILAFGVSVIVLLLWSMRGIRERRSDDITRSVIIVTVIIGALVLVTAGYSNDQIAPAFGLFGTIIGYILGRLGQPGANQPPGPAPGGQADPAAPQVPPGPPVPPAPHGLPP
jgi:hypothetical protein